MTQPAPEHWPTERMILEGHAEFATREDFEGATDNALIEVAEICEVAEAAPDECIPCWAYAEYLERQQAKLENMNPTPPELEDDGDYDEIDTPKLDALVSEVDRIPFEQPVKRPPVERLQLQVAMLAQTLEEILDGPPIPPKEVSLPELGLLVLAADKWVKITESQGMELSDKQQVMLDSTKSLVARLQA